MPRGSIVLGFTCFPENGPDSFKKAREAHLIHKAKTIEHLGINKRDELQLYIVYLLFFVILTFKVAIPDHLVLCNFRSLV